MSQNKTVVPGMEQDNSGREHRNYAHQGGGPQSFYSRNENGRRPARGTVVPGMTDGQAGGQSGRGQECEPSRPRQTSYVGKPVLGFLYSVSRIGAGEYWPLYMGANTVGKNPNCDITLPEATVSDKHATITVRKAKGMVSANIKDDTSTIGTKVNGEDIGFDSLQIQNSDIVTFGENYQCVIILVDAEKLGLSVSKSFIPVDTEDEDSDDYNDPMDNVPHFGDRRTQPGGFSPYQEGPTNWGHGGGGPTDGTVGMDGSSVGNNKGGTIPMY